MYKKGITAYKRVSMRITIYNFIQDYKKGFITQASLNIKEQTQPLRQQPSGKCRAAECFPAFTRCQAFVMASTAASFILVLRMSNQIVFKLQILF